LIQITKQHACNHTHVITSILSISIFSIFQLLFIFENFPVSYKRVIFQVNYVNVRSIFVMQSFVATFKQISNSLNLISISDTIYIFRVNLSGFCFFWCQFWFHKITHYWLLLSFLLAGAYCVFFVYNVRNNYYNSQWSYL